MDAEFKGHEGGPDDALLSVLMGLGTTPRLLDMIGTAGMEQAAGKARR